jgi:hypothetical protein
MPAARNRSNEPKPPLATSISKSELHLNSCYTPLSNITVPAAHEKRSIIHGDAILECPAHSRAYF